MKVAEVAVVGGGIVGLAFAYAHARRGRKVVLFERSDFAVGASVRNFGLLWPIGQAAGAAHTRAMLSREIWVEVIQKANLWHAPTGCFHLAYAPDELAVLEEYITLLCNERFGRELLSPDAVIAKSHAVRAKGLLGGLWSPTEINVDPRQAVRTIPAMLKEAHGVELQFGAHVREISLPKLSTTKGDWSVDEVVVCSGADFSSLYPEIFQKSGMTVCKLQMMRTGRQKDWELGPSLCAGLTLAHYDCFKPCGTLKALKERFAREMSFCVEHGIHVLLSQTALGELTIGDSHHYGLTLDPFNRADVDATILDYLKMFAQPPSFEIAERWDGSYPKLPGKTEFVADAAPGVKIVTGLGGAGMTLSFGLAEEIVSGTFTKEAKTS